MLASRLLRGGAGIALAGLLASCAPTAGGAATYPPGLAVSTSGDVAWVWQGRAFLARRPDYRAQALATPALASSVAWREGEVWLAIPAAGLVFRATSVPLSQAFEGRPALLSVGHTFAEGGNVYDADGALAARLPDIPRSVVENHGRTWVLVGRTIYEIAPDRATAVEQVPESFPAPVIVASGERYGVLGGPAAANGNSLYRLGPNGPLSGSGGQPGEGLIASADDTLATLAAGRLRVYALPGLGLEADIPLEAGK